MSIVVSYSTTSSPAANATTTTGQITSCAARNLRYELAAETDTLIDFVDDVQLDILRRSKWEFLLSAPKYFMTEEAQTDYWVGTAGSNPQGSVDTNLNLSDFNTVKDDSVIDRSNYVLLKRTYERPAAPSLQWQSGIAREGKPAVFRHDPYENQHIINIFPGPINTNDHRAIPATPNAETVVGGALSARRYYFKITFVDAFGGESSASDQAQQFIAASSLIKVKSPKLLLTSTAAGVTITSYKVYASTTSGSEVVQNSATAITLGTDWTESVGGLTTGSAAPPTANTLEPMRGYLMEFRYYKSRPIVDDVNDILVIPDFYRDIVCDGVTAKGFQFLRHFDESSRFDRQFEAGLVTMVRDRNQHPRGGDFIGPDPGGRNNTGSSSWQEYFYNVG